MRIGSPMSVPVLRIIVRNWPLKLGALTLSIALYTGLVFSGSFADDTWRGVPVSFIGQGDTFLLSPTQTPTIDVEYRISREDSELVNADSFSASVDLERYDSERMGQPQDLPITVTAVTDGLQIRDFTPRIVTVTLDRVATKTVPVAVDYGTVPAGVTIGEIDTGSASVEVRGPASAVAQVDRALARVRIDPSGIDFNRQVELEAVDLSGEQVASVDVAPSEVLVNIPVSTVETNKTVPVRPDLVGTPAAGFALEDLVVEPAIVTLRGAPDALAEVDEVLTEPLDIGGLTDDTNFTASLELPDNVRLADPDAEANVAVRATFGPSPVSRTFLVGVRCVNVPAGMSCLPQLEQLALTLRGPAQILRALDVADLTAQLNVSGLGAGSHQIKVTSARLPGGVTLLTLDPDTVAVRLVAPATPTPAPSTPPATPQPSVPATPEPTTSPTPEPGG